MALTEKQKEDLAARKAINEVKRAKKPATKTVKKKPEAVKSEEAVNELVALGQEIDQAVQEVVESNPDSSDLSLVEDAIKQVIQPHLCRNESESITDVLVDMATNVLHEAGNVSTASVDSLELIKEGEFKVTSEELSEIAREGAELLLNATPEEMEKYKTYSGDNLEVIPNDVGLEVVGQLLDRMEEVLENIQEISKDFSEKLDINPDCSIDFTNGRSKPAVYVALGGYGSIQGTYFNEMMKEIVYILTLGGKFDRSVAPRFSGLPFSCKMKIPVDKYSDYVNRAGYPDYEADKETYKVSLSAPDFRVLINSLEKHVELGWEVDPKQACLHKGRYIVPFRLRFPVEITAGLHCKLRTPIKYTVDELREMQWSQVRAIANLHGIEDTNHNAVISQLMTIMENIDG